MTYKMFTISLLAELVNALPPEIIPTPQKSLKNNDEEVDCIIFNTANKDSMYSPVIYPADFYPKLQQGIPLSSIVSEIVKIILNTKTAPEINPEQFEDFDYIKDKICLKLISREFNQKLLESTPYIPYLDLALVCICFFPEKNGFPSGAILIKNSTLDIWSISRNDIFKIAIENTPKIMKPKIITIQSLIAELMGEKAIPDNRAKMYILTNEYRYLGAVCITYPNILSDLSSALKSDLVLIPSSINEFIIMPYKNGALESINSFIKEVNSEFITRQEKLSDHYYIYDRNQKLIRY